MICQLLEKLSVHYDSAENADTNLKTGPHDPSDAGKNDMHQVIFY